MHHMPILERDFKAPKLFPERYRLLNGLGFEWSIAPGNRRESPSAVAQFFPSLSQLRLLSVPLPSLSLRLKWHLEICGPHDPMSINLSFING